VRLGELKGLTVLPIPAVHEQFRNEEVLTVLPAHEATTSHETLLVATRPKLAILTALHEPPGRWVTRWASWDSVAVSEPGALAGQEDVYRLDIYVGGQRFVAALRGEIGRKARRDFVVVVRLSHPAQHANR